MGEWDAESKSSPHASLKGPPAQRGKGQQNTQHKSVRGGGVGGEGSKPAMRKILCKRHPHAAPRQVRSHGSSPFPSLPPRPTPPTPHLHRSERTQQGQNTPTAAASPRRPLYSRAALARRRARERGVATAPRRRLPGQRDSAHRPRPR